MSGIKAIAQGVQSLRISRSEDYKTGTFNLTERASIENIECVLTNAPSEDQYLIEWLANVDNKYYSWPDSVHDETEILSNRVFCEDGDSLRMVSSEKMRSFSRQCVNIRVGGYKLFFGPCDGVAIGASKMPGFVIYGGVPSKEIRLKIRSAISFAFGRPLVHLGHSIFNGKWQLVSFESISPYTMDGKAFELPTLAPAPLFESERFINELNKEKFSHIVNAFYNKYDDYKLGVVSWLYWHAISAPDHIAAVHFGATFEFIQRVFLKANEHLFETSLLDNSVWGSLQKDIMQLIASRGVDTTIIGNKIQSLNQKPQSVLTEEFMDKLGIKLSSLELNAWKQRHVAAHGPALREPDYVRLIKEVKLLKVLCNRVLLSITEGSDSYVDYYSIGFPIRKLQVPIGADDPLKRST
jgi:hypothetical protein